MIEVRCYGCGSKWTDDDLRKAHAKKANLISCCPEREPLSIDQWMERCNSAEKKLGDLSRTLSLVPSGSDRHSETEVFDISRLDEARRFVLEKTSTSYLQRKMQIGYVHAARLMEIFVAEGLI